MAHGSIKITDPRMTSEGFKDQNCTPKPGVMPDCVACEIKTPSAELVVEFDRSEIATMAGSLPDYVPTMDAAHRFIRSNPLTSFEILVGILGIGDEDRAEVSGGRLRELWKACGGAVDKKGRAWVEMETLPFVLRRIIDTEKQIAGATAKDHPDA